MGAHPVLRVLTPLLLAAVAGALVPTASAGKRPAVFVSPKGKDATCARGKASRPCRSFRKAYRLARPGEVVRVARGTYPAQTIVRDARKRRPNVVFRGARGRNPRVKDGLKLGTGTRSGPPASFVTFAGIDVRGMVKIHYEKGFRARHVSFRHMRMGRPTGMALSAGSVLHLTLKNVEVGPICCDFDAMVIALGSSGDPQSSHITFDNVRIHDVRISCAQIPRSVWPRCASESRPHTGTHVDCLQTLGGDNITIRNSQFVNCQTPYQSGISKGAFYWNLRITNSFFEGLHAFDLNCGGPCTYAFRARTPSGRRSYLKLYYNTFANGTRINDVEPGGRYEMVGNIVNGISNGGGHCYIPADGGRSAKFTRVRHNMFTSGASACGRTNVNGKARFVNLNELLGRVNLRLKRGSPGIRRGSLTIRPRRDIDGKRRPVRIRPDLGASQYETALIRTARGIGAARLGMQRARVTRTYGQPRRVLSRRSSSGKSLRVALYRRPRGDLRVSFNRAGSVVGVATSSRYYLTRRGASAGVRKPKWLRMPRSGCRREFSRGRRATTQYLFSRRTGKITWISVYKRGFGRACRP
jgi:hypothetical protein